jgi:nicotinamidase/pyrazinamidase
MTGPADRLQAKDALLIVDVQNDFCPGGALPIREGDLVVPVLNRWIEAAASMRIPVYASRDWHPADHMSFRTSGGSWPAHCLQDTAGAAFHPALALPAGVVKITKGVRFDKDQYSAFDDTGLAERLRHDGVKRLWVGGLALDVCVMATALDGREKGFRILLLREATRPVTPQGGDEALKRMQEAGVEIVPSERDY